MVTPATETTLRRLCHPRSFGLALGLAAALALLGCGQEEEGETVSTQATEAAPGLSESPDKLFPELAAMLNASVEDVVRAIPTRPSGSSGAPTDRATRPNLITLVFAPGDAWVFDLDAEARVMENSYRRFVLWKRVAALLDAHPEWAELNQKWFQNTALPAYERLADAHEPVRAIHSSDRKGVLIGLNDATLRIVKQRSPEAYALYSSQAQLKEAINFWIALRPRLGIPIPTQRDGALRFDLW